MAIFTALGREEREAEKARESAPTHTLVVKTP